MLAVQIINNLGDIFNSVRQLSTSIDNTVINSVQQFITKINSPFFKYIPEVKIWYLGVLMVGMAVPHLDFESQQKSIAKLINKYPNRSIIAVLTAGLVIWLLIL